MEKLNDKKFKTLEKEELKKITGGLYQETYAMMLTHRPYEQGATEDWAKADDTPPGPVYT